MFRSIVLLGVAALAVAQDSSSYDPATVTAQSSAPASSETSSSTSSGPVTHTVGVAKGGHTFVPDVTLAEVGDVIEFDFYPTNHSVIRAEYQYPCIPYEDTGVDKIGFFSGFRPVDAILPDPPKFFITVNDTHPIFYYCGAPGSCIDYQMVGVINPNATTSLVTQKTLAKESTFVLLPGEAWPSEDENPFPTSSSAASATNSADAAATTSAHPSSSHHSTLSAGAIAGIAIGATAVALGAAIALYLCGRHSRNQRHSQMMAHHQPNMPFMPASVAGSMHPGHLSYAPSMNKHMSMHSGYSPALPGYQPSHQSMQGSEMASPPLHPTYAASEALNPGAMEEATSPSHSPGVGVAVPAYSQPGHMAMQPNAHPSMFAPHAPGPNVHEMAAPMNSHGVHQAPLNPSSPASPTEGSGIMGFIRKSSISKAGGVERYG